MISYFRWSSIITGVIIASNNCFGIHFCYSIEIISIHIFRISDYSENNHYMKSFHIDFFYSSELDKINETERIGISELLSIDGQNVFSKFRNETDYINQN